MNKNPIEYIDRDLAELALFEAETECSGMDENMVKKIFALAKNKLDSVNKADVEPVVHAKWEECDYVEPCVHGFGTIRRKNAGLKCKNCVHVFNKKLLWERSFCPNCGAKMDGDSDA